MNRSFTFSLIVIFFVFGCASTKQNRAVNFDKTAERYVRLGLIIGQYDPDFVDAYYGPDSLQPVGKPGATMPKDSILNAVGTLLKETETYSGVKDKALSQRAIWMHAQLKAFERRVRIASGELTSFDDEAKDLFGVDAPRYSEQHFQTLINELNNLLPGEGKLTTKIDALTVQFIIPKDKIDTIFRAAIAEARRRTNQQFTLPAGESFTMEYVTGKPWSGYNWYKGNYTSLIQINTDLPIYIERAIDLACHEGYPGHHVYNVLLEKNLYREKGWVEYSMYPLYSPQSLIAEGSANYGIEVAFPGEEKNRFAKQVLFPLAGFDTSKADVYFKLLELKGKLNYARNEAARGFINGTITEAEALRWLTNYSLYTPEAAAKSLSFIKKYRSYVINYNYGQDMIKNYIESNGGVASNSAKRWELFGWLLSNPITPKDLMQGKK